MEDYKLPNVETHPAYLVSFNATVKQSLEIIERNNKED